MIDNHTASVVVKNENRRLSYADMGMADRKTHRPNKQWELLAALAKNYGVLTWNSRDAHTKHRKRKQMLNEALVRFFRIERGEPVVYEPGEGYKARFHINDGSYPD